VRFDLRAHEALARQTRLRSSTRQALAKPEIGADGSFDSLALSDDESDALDALDARLPDDSDVIAVFRHYFSTHPENFERA
jgi:hypothetical protein